MVITDIFSWCWYKPFVQSSEDLGSLSVQRQRVETSGGVEHVGVAGRYDGGDERRVDNRGQDGDLETLHGDDTRNAVSYCTRIDD